MFRLNFVHWRNGCNCFIRDREISFILSLIVWVFAKYFSVLHCDYSGLECQHDGHSLIERSSYL